MIGAVRVIVRHVVWCHRQAESEHYIFGKSVPNKNERKAQREVETE